MKKYFYILSALFLTVTLGACSKDKEHCDPDDEESPCYVGLAVGDKLLLTEEKTNGKSEMRFEYNDQNQVIVRYVHGVDGSRSEEHTSELQSRENLVCRLLLEKNNGNLANM